MIRGKVNEHDEAVIRVTVIGPTGIREEVEAVIDTGFNGYLTLSKALVDRLELQWRATTSGQLADGTLSEYDLY